MRVGRAGKELGVELRADEEGVVAQLQDCVAAWRVVLGVIGLAEISSESNLTIEPDC